MIGIQKRKRTEGWAADVSEIEVSSRHSSWRHRLAEDNRLWLIVFGAIVVSAFWMIMNLKGNEIEEKVVKAPALPVSMDYADEAHREFSAEFLRNPRYSKSVLHGGFTAPGVFRIVMPSDASADDVDFTSKIAAKLIEHKLKERAAVYTYFRKVATGEEQRAAITTWDAKKQSYVMRMLIDSGK